MEFYEISQKDQKILTAYAAGDKPVNMKTLKSILKRINKRLSDCRWSSYMDPQNRSYVDQAKQLTHQRKLAEMLVKFTEEDKSNTEENNWKREFRRIGSQIDERMNI